MGITTSSNYGRINVAWPDFAHEGGTALHAKITNGIKKLSDNIDCRYSGLQTLANTDTFDLVHDFNLSLDQLQVEIYESNARLASEAKGRGYLITEVNANTIRIQNVSGGSKTFYALALCNRTEPGQHVGWAETANATPATLLTYDIPTDKAALVVARVCGRKDGTTAAAYEVKALIEDNGGTASVSLMEKTQVEDAPAWDVTIDATGGTARVRVTGGAGETISWTGVLETTYM